MLGRLQIGQQAYLLQNPRREVLGFVNHEDRSAALGVCLQQIAVQSVHQALGGPILLQKGDAKLVADGTQKFGCRQGGVQDEGQIHLIGQLF